MSKKANRNKKLGEGRKREGRESMHVLRLFPRQKSLALRILGRGRVARFMSYCTTRRLKIRSPELMMQGACSATSQSSPPLKIICVQHSLIVRPPAEPHPIPPHVPQPATQQISPSSDSTPIRPLLHVGVDESGSRKIRTISAHRGTTQGKNKD